MLGFRFLKAVGRVRANLNTARCSYLSSTSTSNSNDVNGDKDLNLQVHGNVLGGEHMTPAALNTFETWHRSVSKAMHSDLVPNPDELKESMYSVVHTNCKFHPPTYFTPWEGRDEMLLLLSSVSEVFGKSFKYGRQWISPDGHDWALEFTASIGDSNKSITGVDLIKLDDEGLIVEFTVLARPPNGVAELKSQMMQKVPPRLAKLKLKQGMEKIFGS